MKWLFSECSEGWGCERRWGNSQTIQPASSKGVGLQDKTERGVCVGLCDEYPPNALGDQRLIVLSWHVGCVRVEL